LEEVNLEKWNLVLETENLEEFKSNFFIIFLERWMLLDFYFEFFFSSDA
jgi:hypothetical protein